MLCYRCSGEMKHESVSFTMHIPEIGKTVVIKRVPASVCQQCMEQSFDLDVARNLEALRDRATRKQLLTSTEDDVTSADHAVHA